MRGLVNLLGNLVRRRRVDADIADELRAAFDILVDEHVQSGMPLESARRAARLQLGSPAALSDEIRDARAGNGVESFAQDVRYAVRTLLRAPVFTAMGALTLALGIGANIAMFSVVYGILLRPLPYRDAERLVRVYQANPGLGMTDGLISVTDFDDWRAQTRAFGSGGAFASFPMIVTGLGDPMEVPATAIHGDFFGTLGASAAIGRLLREDDVRQASLEAVVSDRFWRRYLGGDPSAIGRSIAIGRRSFRIAGVAPRTFGFPTPQTDLWFPYSVFGDDEVGPRTRGQRNLEGVMRLADGATVDQARAELTTVARRLAAEYPQSNAGWTAATVVPLRRAIVGDVDVALMLVLGVVGFILLIGCVNLANLLLARGSARAREIATRAALGAPRSRIVRQLLTESVVLALLGGLLGAGVAAVGVRTLLSLSGETLPRREAVAFDAQVMLFGLGLAVATGLLFGVLPALRMAEVAPHLTIKEARGVAGGQTRVRTALVVSEVALALVLVIGAGLMTRSFLALRLVDPGFDPGHVLAVTMQYNIAGVQGRDLVRHLVERREEIIRRIAELPGVVDAGSITSLPPLGQCRDFVEFFRADGTGGSDGSPLRADNCLVSTNYLRTMRIPLVRGEPLPDRPPGPPAGALPDPNVPPVRVPLLVNETAARRFWPGQEAIGQVLRPVRGGGRGEAIVVGVARDVRQAGLAETPQPVIYMHQRGGPRAVTTFVVRASGDPRALAGPIRDLVREVDPAQPIREIATLEDAMSESIARDRFFTVLFWVFGALALVLAAIGVYGVLAYSVNQRRREIGLRVALGAGRGEVLRMIMGEGMRPVLVGVAAGALGSLFLAQLLRRQLYGISATDPVAFFVAATVLGAAALLACYLPARRIVSVDPMFALREE